VLIARAFGSDAFEKTLEVAQQQRFVFVDRQAESRVQRLEMQAPHPHAGPTHFFAKAVGDVDEFSGPRGLEA